MFQLRAICIELLLAFLPGTYAFGAEAESNIPCTFEEPRYLTGSIFSSDKRELLFTFKRIATISGSTINVHREFAYPNGKLAAREEVVYSQEALVSYKLEETQIGASGTAIIRRPANDSGKGVIEFQYARGKSTRPKTRTEPLRNDTLIADMVGPFLASQWDALSRGEKVKCRYAVVSRAETVGFTFLRTSDGVLKGQPVLNVKMEATSPILARLVDPLTFAVEKAPPHHVLQYEGRTTPKLHAGDKWADFDALTVFDWTTAR